MHLNDGFPSARALRIGTATVAGVIVLLAGLVIGRVTASSSAPSTSGGSSPAPSTRGVPAWATGATRVDHGVPVGYAHTADGAVAAARNYLLALNATPLSVDPAATRAAYAAVSTPSFEERHATVVERTLAGLADLITASHQGHVTRVLPFVLSSHLDQYSQDEARVTVWGGVVFAVDGVIAPQEMTSEETYALRWLGDWQIDDRVDADGPGVKSLNAAAQTNSLPAELGDRFQGIGDVARG